MKKFIAATTAAFFAVALVLVGAAAPASAHAAALSVGVTCNDAAGTAVVTWTIDNDYNEQLNVTASNNAAIPVGTTLAATGGNADTTKSFVQNVSAPAGGKNLTATLSFRWDGDNFTQNNTTQSIVVPPTCGVKSDPNPTPTPTPSPTGTPVQSDAAAALVHTPATCTSGETVAEGAVSHATWQGDISYSGVSNSTYTAVAVATPHHQFPNGTGVSANHKSKTFTGTLDGQKTVDCGPPAVKDASATVTFSPGTCGAPGTFASKTAVNATFEGDAPIISADGSTWTWTVDAATGHSFADGTATEVLTGAVPAAIPFQNTDQSAPCFTEPPADATASVTFSGATCTTAGSTPVADIHNAIWTRQDVDVAAGTYDWVAIAESGHEFSTGVSRLEFQGNLPAPIPAQSTSPSAPCYVAPPVSVTDPTASVCQQSTDTALTSWVHINAAPHVEYHIYPAGQPGAAVVLNSGYTAEPAGSYTIVADAEPGFTLAATATQPAGTEHVWNVSVADSSSPECIKLPVGATWHAGATAATAVCTSGDVQLGTITLEHLASETGRVDYTVTNEATNAVVYHGNSRSSVSVAPGTYDVTAKAHDSADGISGPDTFDGLVVGAVSAGCSSLSPSSLAFTGTNGTVGLYLAGGLLFLGIAGLFVRRRFGRRVHQ